MSKDILPLAGASITKTYTVVEPDGRRCRKLLRYGGRERYDDYDEYPCRVRAVLCIDIITVSIRGQRVVSRTGYCQGHLSQRLRRQFSILRA